MALLLNLCSKAEPLGWNFEDIKSREDLIPSTWWFIPWSNTEYCELSKDSPYAGKTEKLLYYDVHPVKEQYRGSGIVVDDIEGRVVGCYKIRADTEVGDDFKKEVTELKHRQWLEDHGQAPVEPVYKRKPKTPNMANNVPGPEKLLRLGNEKYDGKPLNLPNEIRRLNGLILDPRPVKIALHHKNREAFRTHHNLAGGVLKDYGAQYLQLEHRIRNAMKDTFDKDLDLPIYRLRQMKAAEKAGRPEVEYTEEQSSESEEEKVRKVKVKVKADDVDSHEGIEEADSSDRGGEEDEDADEGDKLDRSIAFSPLSSAPSSVDS